MQPIASPSAPALERRAVAFVVLALGATVVAASGLGILGRLTDVPIPPLLVAVLGPAALLAVVVATDAVRVLAARLPPALDGWFRGRRLAGALWALLAVAAVANTARFGAFMADRSTTWGSMAPFIPDLAKHECLPAYVRAGELASRGQDNLWQRSDYDDDAYEYPPPFAVPALTAVTATDDYALLRAGWFGINALAFLIVAVMLASWVGGRAGGSALLLLPALALSTPLLLNLQFGQAHLLVVVAAVAALPLFARGRPITGGALLGFAIVTKIFPGLLLVHLAMRRQWHAVAATLAAVAAYLAISVAVLGPGTMRAFATEHLPAVASGKAFPNVDTNDDNGSLYGLVFKLHRLGVPGMDQALASRVLWAFGLVAVVMVVLASRRRRDRAGDAVLWLGIIALATLRSPFAPTYSAITALWLLSLWSGDGPRRAGRTALIALGWIFIQGSPPIFGARGNILVSLVPQAIALVIAFAAVSRRATSAPDP